MNEIGPRREFITEGREAMALELSRYTLVAAPLESPCERNLAVK